MAHQIENVLTTEEVAECERLWNTDQDGCVAQLKGEDRGTTHDDWIEYCQWCCALLMLHSAQIAETARKIKEIQEVAGA